YRWFGGAVCSRRGQSGKARPGAAVSLGFVSWFPVVERCSAPHLFSKGQHVPQRNSKPQGLVHWQVAVGASNGEGADTALLIRKRNQLPRDPLMAVFWLDVKILKYSRFTIVKSRVCIADRTARYQRVITSAPVK